MHLPFDLNIQPFIHYLHIHPQLAGAFAFFVVFLEALAVVGVIIPGSVTMTAIGTLIGSNVIPAGYIFVWAIAGAISGDFLSYLFGVHFQDRLHSVWPFKKRPELLQKSENFFAKHGGKSVIIGRFIGPMRAMVPMVAGMLKMPLAKFVIVAVPSAAFWAISYMIPGIILGALSLELPPKIATQFILAVLALILLVWGMTWLAHHFSKRIYRWLDSYVMKLWLYMQSHRSLRWATELLADPREPENHQQLSLFFLGLCAALAFFLVFNNIAHYGALTIFNDAVYNLLLSLRTDLLDGFAVAITLLGEKKMLLIAGVLLLVWLIYKRYWYVALNWFVILLLSYGAVFEIKSFFFSPRPGGELNFQHTSSFPSGHTAISLSLMGFWSVVVARESTPARRWLPYVCCGVIVVAIALSRLYLGAHWLTDILGSALLAAVLVLILAVSYRRRHISRNFSLPGFVIISICALLISWAGYIACKYTEELQNYTVRWPVVTIAKQDWAKEVGKNIPLYRINRLGKPIQAFNVEWAGLLDDISQNLSQRGWKKMPMTLDLHGIALRILGDPTVSHLTLFPQLYHNRPMALIMMKETDQDNRALVLRLWQSDIKFSDCDLPLWLGVVESHYAEPKLIRLPSNNKKYPRFVGAVEELSGYVKNFKWKKVIVPPEQQPAEMRGLHWDGTVFLLQPKSNGY